MTLKHILYTSTAALAMIAPTLATSVVANAATGAPTQTTAQAGKTNNNQQAGKTTNNKDNKQASDKNANSASAKADNQNTNSASAKTTGQQAAKTNDNKATDNKAASSAPAKTTQATTSNHASTNNDVKATSAAAKTTPAKTDATQSLSKVDFGSFKASTPTKVAQDYTHKAPRYTGSSYTTANHGYSTSVTATNDNSTLNYAVSTYNSDGSASSQPFAIKIYKDGSLYKTLKSSTGAAKGSLNVDKGTYTLKVLTSASAHYTGGLSLS